MKLKSLFDRTINWIYPYRCPICSKLILDSDYLCKNCQKDIYLNQPPYCKLCGIHIPEYENLCKDCKLLRKKQIVWYDRVISPFLYKATTKEIIHIIKYNKKLPLAYYMGKFLAQFLINAKLKDIDYIIPVPLHPAKLRQRGFNQSEIFARMISKLTNIKFLSNILYREKSTIPQAELSKQERFKNVKHAFSIKNKYQISNTNILLIDDIFTTGATINECSRILKQNGVNYILVATLARG